MSLVSRFKVVTQWNSDGLVKFIGGSGRRRWRSGQFFDWWTEHAAHTECLSFFGHCFEECDHFRFATLQRTHQCSGYLLNSQYECGHCRRGWKSSRQDAVDLFTQCCRIWHWTSGVLARWNTNTAVVDLCERCTSGTEARTRPCFSIVLIDMGPENECQMVWMPDFTSVDVDHCQKSSQSLSGIGHSRRSALASCQECGSLHLHGLALDVWWSFQQDCHSTSSRTVAKRSCSARPVECSTCHCDERTLLFLQGHLSKLAARFDWHRRLFLGRICKCSGHCNVDGSYNQCHWNVSSAWHFRCGSQSSGGTSQDDLVWQCLDWYAPYMAIGGLHVSDGPCLRNESSQYGRPRCLVASTGFFWAIVGCLWRRRFVWQSGYLVRCNRTHHGRPARCNWNWSCSLCFGCCVECSESYGNQGHGASSGCIEKESGSWKHSYYDQLANTLSRLRSCVRRSFLFESRGRLAIVCGFGPRGSRYSFWNVFEWQFLSHFAQWSEKLGLLDIQRAFESTSHRSVCGPFVQEYHLVGRFPSRGSWNNRASEFSGITEIASSCCQIGTRIGCNQRLWNSANLECASFRNSRQCGSDGMLPRTIRVVLQIWLCLELDPSLDLFGFRRTGYSDEYMQSYVHCQIAFWTPGSRPSRTCNRWTNCQCNSGSFAFLKVCMLCFV